MLGTAVATTPDGTAYNYWMASRYYYYLLDNYYYWIGRNVRTSGFVDNSLIPLYDYNSVSFDSAYANYSLRPILTLKSGLKYSGLGTETYPMEISTS